jgi:hypothetical protein
MTRLTGPQERTLREMVAGHPSDNSAGTALAHAERLAATAVDPTEGAAP